MEQASLVKSWGKRDYSKQKNSKSKDLEVGEGLARSWSRKKGSVAETGQVRGGGSAVRWEGKQQPSPAVQCGCGRF